MTPIETTEEMLSHLNLSPEELREINVVVDEMAESIVRGFWERHKINYERTNNNAPGGAEVSRNGLLSNTSEQGKNPAD